MIFGICDWDILDASFRLTLIKYSLKSFGMVIWSKIFLLLRMRCFGSEYLTILPLPITSFIICQVILFYPGNEVSSLSNITNLFFV